MIDIEIKVYLDLVFIINYIYDFIGIYLTGIVSEEEKRVRRFMVSALLYAAMDVIFFLVSRNWHVLINICIYIFVECLGIYIAFGKLKLKKYMVLIMLHSLILFTMGGMVQAVKSRIGNSKYKVIGDYVELIIISILVILLIKYIMPYVIKSIYYKERIYKVTISLKGNVVEMKGLLDSGNALREQTTNKGVTIVEKHMLKEFFNVHIDKIYIIPFKSVGKDEGMLYGIQVDELIISHAKFQKKTKDAIIGIYNGKLSNDNRYNAILHSESLM